MRTSPLTILWMLTVLVWLAFSGRVTAASGKAPLTTAGVLSMIKAGLSDNTVILAIRKGPTEFDTSAPALIKLKEGGADEKVLNAVLDPAGTATTQANASSRPSVAAAQSYLANQVTKESQGRIRLVAFRKTNGQTAEIFGVRIYTLQYDAEVEFTKNCKWLWSPSRGPSFQTLISPSVQRHGFSWSKFLDATQNPGFQVKRGQGRKISGALQFQRTEQGWRVHNSTFTIGAAVMLRLRTEPTPATTGAAPPTLDQTVPKLRVGAKFRALNGKSSITIRAGHTLEYVNGRQRTTGTFTVDHGTNVAVTYQTSDGRSYMNYHLTRLGLQDSRTGIWFSQAGLRQAPASMLRDQCIKNLQEIDGAKEWWALEHKEPSNAMPTIADLLPYLPGRKLPTCPAGGTYTIGSLYQTPTCSMPGHKL